MLDDLRSPVEEFARTALNGYLLRRGFFSLEWQQVRDDPPDYYVTIGGHRFGVEVTALMDRLLVGGKHRSTEEIAASLRAFVEEVENAAREAGILHGTYGLALDPIDSFRQVAPQIRDRVLAYVCRTQGAACAGRETLYSRGASRWWIEKLSANESCIGGLFSVNDAKWEGEIIADATQLLSEVIATKARKLSRVPAPSALLLVDRYHFADDEEWAQAVPSVVAPPICALIRVRDGGTCQPLWSRAPWLG